MISELIDPAILGFILIGVMLFSIFVGFPISFTLLFLGFCFWLFRFWKTCFLFNDLAVFNGHDRTNFGRRTPLCVYGYNDGASRFNGKVIFSISV